MIHYFDCSSTTNIDGMCHLKLTFQRSGLRNEVAERAGKRSEAHGFPNTVTPTSEKTHHHNTALQLLPLRVVRAAVRSCTIHMAIFHRNVLSKLVQQFIKNTDIRNENISLKYLFQQHRHHCKWRLIRQPKQLCSNRITVCQSIAWQSQQLSLNSIIARYILELRGCRNSCQDDRLRELNRT